MVSSNRLVASGICSLADLYIIIAYTDKTLAECFLLLPSLSSLCLLPSRGSPVIEPFLKPIESITDSLQEETDNSSNDIQDPIKKSRYGTGSGFRRCIIFRGRSHSAA